MRKKKFIIPLIAILRVGIAGLVAYIVLKNQGVIGNTGGDETIQLITVDYESDVYDISHATTITATDGNINISGGGAEDDGRMINITNSGVYVLSGNIERQITINAPKKIVTLVLDNATITNKEGTAIYAQEVKRTLIASKDGTTNKIVDGKSYSTNYGEEDVDAAIYSKDDLVIAGTGTIEISGNHNHGIHGKDFVQILSGTLSVTSVNDGIVAKDYFAMKDGNLNIESASDGIKSTEDDDVSRGFIAFNGGTVNITSTGDAVNSINRISITNGNFNFVTGGGAVNTSETYGEWGKWQSSKSKDTSGSAKGLKAEKYIIIAGGNFNFDVSDDAIHSNTNIVINNGNYAIKTGDDAIHADTSITINNGTINMPQAHEGIESSTITINDGTILIVADDDGLNASGGKDKSSLNNRPGKNHFSSTTGTIYINGGRLEIVTQGDGLDSNGSIEMTGGYVTVDGPTTNNNGSVDYNDSFKMTGGTLIAAGSSGMLMTPSDDSSQLSIAFVFGDFQPAESTFTLKDNSNNVIAEFKPTQKYTSVVISTPNIKLGSNYTANINGNDISTVTTNGIITNQGGGGMPGGGGRR